MLAVPICPQTGEKLTEVRRWDLLRGTRHRLPGRTGSAARGWALPGRNPTEYRRILGLEYAEVRLVRTGVRTM
jgi:hypothetical protein